MPLQAGIVGLPNVGKSTLFNAITRAGAEAANYPFCTIDPNVGVVEVPDVRLNGLARIVKPKRIVPTTFEFVDIAGLVAGASQGEGLGNKFLGHIRDVDAIIHVVRCFEDGDVTHVSGSVSPERDMDTIDLELVMADLESVTRRLERTKKNIKSGEKRYAIEAQALTRLSAALDDGRAARSVELSEEECEALRDVPLLTKKPLLYVANVSETDIQTNLDDNPLVAQVHQRALRDEAEFVVVSAQLEAEISDLDAADRAAFLGEAGLTESGLDRLIRSAYHLLGLITYFTAGEPEVRAWTIVRRTKAPAAAAVIHTDFERGFIRAEVVGYDDLVTAGSYTAARESGKLRLEGKEYVMQDGDVVHFRFNV